MMHRRVLVFSAVAACLALVAHATVVHTPVLNTDIQTLTLQRGALTTARRVEPMPQLTCRGPHCAAHQPDVVQCTNAGTDGGNVQWTCRAELPQWLRFGAMDVSCEGYSRAGDPYVLAGSCGLVYELVGTPPPPVETPPPRVETHQPPPRAYSPPTSHYYPPATSPTESSVNMIMLCFTLGVALVVVVFIVAACIHAATSNNTSHPTVVRVDPLAPRYVPASPAYVAPAYTVDTGYRHESSSFASGMWLGSMLGGSSSRPSTTYVEHHHHSPPRRESPPRRRHSPPPTRRHSFPPAPAVTATTTTTTKEGYATSSTR